MANPAAGGHPGAVQYEATCNCHFANNYPWAFGPRLGTAYQITPKTVFRSGVGQFFNRQIVGGSVFPGGNPPLQPMVSIANAEVDNPSGGKQSFWKTSGVYVLSTVRVMVRLETIGVE